MSRSNESRPVVSAFVNRTEHKNKGGMHTNGNELFMYGNRIAWWTDNDTLSVQASGFGQGSVKEGYYVVQKTPTDYQKGDFTSSPTTLHRLNMLPGVSVSRMKNVTYLNGKKWDGSPIKIK